MPCIILTGHPSCGKTTIANKLKERALAQGGSIDNVIILNEEGCCPDHSKEECYKTSHAEKQTRGALKSAFDRAKKTPSTLIILDSLNYIKGFRYELHCISKASGEKHAIVWVLNTLENVQAWNKSYSPELLKELVQRYEPPDDRNRWDKPLYTVNVSGGDASSRTTTETSLAKSVYNMHALGDVLGGENTTATTTTASDATSKQQQQGGGGEAAAKKQEVAAPKKPKRSAFSRAKKSSTKATSTPVNPSGQGNTTEPATSTNTEGDGKSAAATATTAATTTEASTTTANVAKTVDEQLDDILKSILLEIKPLKEGNSTRQHIAGDANVLQELDSTTQRLVSIIMNAQNFTTGGKLQIKTPSGKAQTSINMECKRSISLAELRRYRKQYLVWVGNHPPDDRSELGITTSFIKYIQEQL